MRGLELVQEKIGESDLRSSILSLALISVLLLGFTEGGSYDTETDNKQESAQRLILQPEQKGAPSTKNIQGIYKVYEDRDSREGRMLEIEVMVMKAKASDPEPDPIFILVGGPGSPALPLSRMLPSWMREERDVVLVNLRGTGDGARLDCKLPGSDEDLQSYLDPIFSHVDAYRDCLDVLKDYADLTQYSTFTAVEDLNDIRLAFGYDRINLYGMSYGTRAALIYMRYHPETVRTAVLNGTAPVSLINALYHAASAQGSIEQLFSECAADAGCNKAYPDLDRKLAAVLSRLDQKPAEVTIPHPAYKSPVTLELTRDAFAEALRIMLYSPPLLSQVPYYIQKAYEGDLKYFVQTSVMYNRMTRHSLALGLYLCVTCAEDIARIEPQQIPDLTKDTFYGDGRVRRLMEICDFWPKSFLREDFGEPVQGDIPLLVLSGKYDPVTSPHWGAEVARNFPNSLHLVAPSSHVVIGPCIDAIMQEFLRLGSVRDLDVSCIKKMTLPPFKYR